MEKIFIKNRKGQKISVLIEQPAGKPEGLAFVMHGLSGIKERPHLETFAQAFLDNGYISVRFDTTNTFGESEGSYEEATLTNAYEDFEDVIAWAKTQPWYTEPFCLVGHSLGAISGALYAQKHPNVVKGLAPISTVVSGALMIEADQKYRPMEYASWEKTGWRIGPSESTPGLVKKLKWNQFKSDILKYDLLPQAAALTMPVLLIVGSGDTVTPSEHQRLLLKAIPHSQKELHVIKDAPHTFVNPEHLKEIQQIFNLWIKKYG